MEDKEVLNAIVAEEVSLQLTTGKHLIKTLTLRRLIKLAALLKNVQGDPSRFKDPNNPEFYNAISDALVAADDKMPDALCLLSGDESFKEKDITVLDLPIFVEAVVRVNKPQELLSGFRRVIDSLKSEQK